MSRYDDYFYPPYVSVTEKKERNAAMARKLAAKNKNLKPVVITGNKIANTFWGKAWCDNVESYQDYENRLPRGRSYVRAGAVIDLQITTGNVTALVAGSGSQPYKIKIEIQPLGKTRWEALKKKCVGKISSLLALAQGKLPPDILAEFCNREGGLFPSPKEIKTDCSCPDWADLCKHLAAVMYGIGAQLDENPKLFFILRGIDENELIGSEVIDTLTEGVISEIAPENISAVFGVEFDSLENVKPVKKTVPISPPITMPKPVTEWTSKKILELRKRHHLTQAAFGKLLGVSASAVFQWEHRDRAIHKIFSGKFDKLACKLNMLPIQENEVVKPAKSPVAETVKWTPKKIVRLRAGLDISQTAFGKLVGIGAMTVSNWERGKTSPSEAMNRKLSEVARGRSTSC